MRGTGQTGPSQFVKKLELELQLQLNDARRAVGTQERAHNTGGRPHRFDDLPEVRVGNVIHRLIEVRMIEQVEELHPKPELCILTDGEELGHAEVGVEVTGPGELIPALIGET